MGVHYGKSCCCISGHDWCIATHCFNLFYRINDILACLLLVEVAPCMCPTVSCIQRYFFSGFYSVCIKLYFDLIRSQSVLVIIIIPCLGYCDTGLSRCVAVGDVISFDVCCVISYRIFCYSVSNQLSICILVKVVKCIAPAVCFCYCLACI